MSFSDLMPYPAPQKLQSKMLKATYASLMNESKRMMTKNLNCLFESGQLHFRGNTKSEVLAELAIKAVMLSHKMCKENTTIFSASTMIIHFGPQTCYLNLESWCTTHLQEKSHCQPSITFLPPMISEQALTT